MEVYIFSDGEHGNKTVIKNTKKALQYLLRKYEDKKIVFLTEIFSSEDFPIIKKMEEEKKLFINNGVEVYKPIIDLCLKKEIKILPLKSSLKENHEKGILENCLVYLRANKSSDVYVIDIGEAHVDAFFNKIKEEFNIKPKIFYFTP